MTPAPRRGSVRGSPKPGYASAADFSDGFVAATGVAAGLSLLAARAGTALPARPLTSTTLEVVRSTA